MVLATNAKESERTFVLVSTICLALETGRFVLISVGLPHPQNLISNPTTPSYQKKKYNGLTHVYYSSPLHLSSSQTSLSYFLLSLSFLSLLLPPLRLNLK